ncbi:MAG: hypothetical protein WC659_03415 [Patescibacteria group bacterium]
MPIILPRKRLLEYLGLVLIFCFIGAVVVMGVRSKQAEARDRGRLDDIKDIRVALQEYFKQQGSFPAGDQVTLGKDGGGQLCAGSAQKGFLGSDESCGEGAAVFLNPIPADINQNYSYQFRALPEECTDACGDYELAFSLEYGAAEYGKGSYRANRAFIIPIAR